MFKWRYSWHLIKSSSAGNLCQNQNNRRCHSIEKWNSINPFSPRECFDNVLEIEAKRSFGPHNCRSYLSLHVFQINSKHPTAWEMTTLQRQPEVTLWWTQWSISAVDFSGEIVTPWSFWRGPYQRRPNAGSLMEGLKEMICGQSSTLMVLHAVHTVAAEYIVEMGRGTRIQFDQAERQIPLNIFLLLTHLRRSKSLAQCF